MREPTEEPGEKPDAKDGSSDATVHPVFNEAAIISPLS